MRSLLLLGLARIATSFTHLAGVSPLEADGLVIVVAELSIELSKKVCTKNVSSPSSSYDEPPREQRGDWVLDLGAASHRGSPRPFWYNEATHQSRWADKFTPLKNSKRQQQQLLPRTAAGATKSFPAGSGSVGGTAYNWVKLRERVRPLTYDNEALLCADDNNPSFVQRHHVPPPSSSSSSSSLPSLSTSPTTIAQAKGQQQQRLCAHFLSAVPLLVRKRMKSNPLGVRKGIQFDQFILEHTLLSKFLALASVECSNYAANFNSNSNSNRSTGSTSSTVGDSFSSPSASAAAARSLVCSSQLAKAQVVVVPSLVFHCTPDAHHGFMNKLLKDVLTYEGYVAFWGQVREAFFDPFVLKADRQPPLVVVPHRFVWDLPHFRWMLTSLIATQPPEFVERVLIPGLESNLLASERLALFPKGWDGFVSTQLNLRRHLRREKGSSSSSTLTTTKTTPTRKLGETPPGIQVTAAKTTAGKSSPAAAIATTTTTTTAAAAVPLLVSMPYPLPILEPIQWFAEDGGSGSGSRPVLVLFYGDASKPAFGRWAARQAMGRHDSSCTPAASPNQLPVCWVCSAVGATSGAAGARAASAGAGGGGAGAGAGVSDGAEWERRCRNSKLKATVEALRRTHHQRHRPPPLLGRNGNSSHLNSLFRTLPPPPPPPLLFSAEEAVAAAAAAAAAAAMTKRFRFGDFVTVRSPLSSSSSSSPFASSNDFFGKGGQGYKLREWQGILGQVIGPHLGGGVGGQDNDSSEIDATTTTTTTTTNHSHRPNDQPMVDVLFGGASGNGGSSSGGAKKKAWSLVTLPAAVLSVDETGTCGDSVWRHDNLWRLTVSSTFCVQPAGDTPTRSHLYLSVLLGCIPVLLEGGAPAYGSGPTAWAFRRKDRNKVKDAHRDNGDDDDDDGNGNGKEDGGSFQGLEGLDYDSFCVRFNASELATTFDASTLTEKGGRHNKEQEDTVGTVGAAAGRGVTTDAAGERGLTTTTVKAGAQVHSTKIDLVSALAALSPARVATLRKGLDEAAHLLRYAPITTTAAAAAAAVAAGGAMNAQLHPHQLKEPSPPSSVPPLLVSPSVWDDPKSDAFSALLTIVNAAYGDLLE